MGISTSDGNYHEDPLDFYSGRSEATGASAASGPITPNSEPVKEVIPPKQVSGLTKDQLFVAKDALEPFGQLGKLITGNSENIPMDALGVTIAAIPGPGKAAEAAEAVGKQGLTTAFTDFMDQYMGHHIRTQQKDNLRAVASKIQSGDAEGARSLSSNIIEEARRQLNAFIGGFNTKVYHGTRSGISNISMHTQEGLDQQYLNGMITNKEHKDMSEELKGTPIQGDFYGSTDPALANLYSGVHPHIAKEVERGEFTPGHELSDIIEEKAGVVPMRWNTEDFHEVDAGGALWKDVIPKYVEAINKAKDEGRGGVIIRNVWDEPTGESKGLMKPKDVYIAIKGNTVRSANAKFDPSKFHLNDLLASGAAIAIPAGTAIHAMKDNK